MCLGAILNLYGWPFQLRFVHNVPAKSSQEACLDTQALMGLAVLGGNVSWDT